MLGFFSFTEVTEPSAHRAYNEWHRLDHLPEQFSLDGVLFGQRWVCSPACREARVAVSPRLEPCHYMTLYLMRDADVLPGFAALAQRLRQADRFFAARRALVSGPFEVRDRWVSPRVKVSAEVVPHRPAQGIYVVVGPPVDGEAMVAQPGVAGAWSFVQTDDGPATGAVPGRHITVAFIDGDLASTAPQLGRWCLEQQPARSSEWAGPLERLDRRDRPDGLDTDPYDWFDRLTPQ